MKSAIAAALLLASAVSAFIHPTDPHVVKALSKLSAEAHAEPEPRRLIEVAPYQTRWVTEDEMLELRRQRVNFMDITDNQHLGFKNAVQTAQEQALARTSGTKKHTRMGGPLPTQVAFSDVVTPMLSELNKDNLRSHLEKFTSFYTRYYRSDDGAKSSDWLFQQISETAAVLPDVTVTRFKHSWNQRTNIATIPGKTEKTVVIGAHQDSTVLFLPQLMRSPGADDDGSGTVTILEAFRVLVNNIAKTGKKPENTIEFHWYSAEEAGLLGSQDVFKSYEDKERDVVAMLQQDMTGFSSKTKANGKPDSVGVITDYVDPDLTTFIKEVITKYCDIPFVLTKCGYACSDHASASKAGYRSAFVIESTFEDSDDHIHSGEDKIEFLDFDHMLQHAKLTLALAYELGNHDFIGTQESPELGGGEL